MSGYAPADVYVLTKMDNRAVDTAITLDLGTAGQIAGNAPCNRYSGPQTVPYPWFAAGPFRVTRRACPDLALEQRYLAALARMTLAEAAGNILILSNEAGEELVFQARP